MDQIKTGKFIASLRKEKGLAQMMLADCPGISDKTVSKWERGAGLPDVSLMLPLCKTLEISVNEPLTGEKLTDAGYKKKAEVTFMDLVQENKENKKSCCSRLFAGLSRSLRFSRSYTNNDIVRKEVGINLGFFFHREGRRR